MVMLQSFVTGRSRPRRTPHFLALLAMLFQFAFSFGHFHAQDFASLQSGYQPLAIAHAQIGGGGVGQVPTGDVDCPICSSIQQLGSTALIDGMSLSLPDLQQAGFVLASEPLRLTPPPHLLFNTRGPPIV
jgi:hypothetical protein